MYDMLNKIKQTTILLRDTYYSATKIFNEVYYQCTRIAYEQNPNVQLRDYVVDIKSNIGTHNHARVVYGLIYYLLSHRNNNSLIDIKYRSHFLMRFRIGAVHKTNFPDELEYPLKSYDIDLSPRPCHTSMLNNMMIDWEEVTNCFDKESIGKIVNLYEEVTERKKIYSMIEHAFEVFYKKQGKSFLALKARNPNMADYRFFYDFNEVNPKDFSCQPCLCCEEEPVATPTYRELEEENINLKKRLEAALTENESLKSALNMMKPKRQQETSFTVSMIVDYCKRIPEYSHVAAIEKMLYRFSKKCSEKEEMLIDSISEHFNKKRFGDTVIGNKNIFDGNSQQIDVDSKERLDLDTILNHLAPALRKQVKKALENYG